MTTPWKGRVYDMRFPSAFTIACLLAISVSVKAGPIPAPLWSYRSPFNEVVFPDGASGALTFPNLAYVAVTGDADIVAERMLAWSVAAASSADRVDAAQYRFGLELRDAESGESGTLIFGGSVTGSYWKAGADLHNRFDGPTAQSVDLGRYVYSVSLLGFEPPFGYGAAAGGQILARVSVTGAGVGETVTTPEPATVLLVLCGVPTLALIRLKRLIDQRLPERGI